MQEQGYVVSIVAPPDPLKCRVISMCKRPSGFPFRHINGRCTVDYTAEDIQMGQFGKEILQACSGGQMSSAKQHFIAMMIALGKAIALAKAHLHTPIRILS